MQRADWIQKGKIMAFDVDRYLGKTMEFAGVYRVEGVATSLVGHSLRATLKADPDDDADPGVAQITTASTANGQITLETGDSIANAGYRLKFKPAATLSQAHGTVLYLDVSVVQPDGDVFIIDPAPGELCIIRLWQPGTRTNT